LAKKAMTTDIEVESYVMHGSGETPDNIILFQYNGFHTLLAEFESSRETGRPSANNDDFFIVRFGHATHDRLKKRCLFLNIDKKCWRCYYLKLLSKKELQRKGIKKMPQQSSESNTQKDILGILDKVVKTGVPMEIERKGIRLVISPAKKHRNLDCLEDHPGFIIGNPDNLVHIDWTAEWKPQL
jgi:hypothetical protein